MSLTPRAHEIKRADQLSADERDGWTAMVAGRESLWSPYFQLEYIDAMQALSDRVRVVVAREAGAPVAFLPYLPVVMGYAQPVGGPVCDTHGVIAADPAHADVEAMFEAAGVSLFGFHGVPADQAGFETGVRYRYDCLSADLSAGYQAWYDRESENGTKKSFKRLARDTRMIERDYGPLRFELNDASERAFETLIAWKRDQYRRSRYFDVFSVPWTEKLLRMLWARQEGPLQGRLSTLYAGDRLLAAHFGMQGARAANHWIPAYDPDHAKWGPGKTLTDMLYRAWAEEGVRRVDLGGGESEFKLHFSGVRLPMLAGVMTRDTASTRAYRGFGVVSNAIAKAPAPFIAKAPHRVGVRIRNRLLYKLV